MPRGVCHAGMMTRVQRLVPGIIGFAPATDYLYLREIQAAAAGESAPGLVNSVRTLYATLDADAFFALDEAGETAAAGALISATARSLQAAGADFLVVTSNTGSIILEEAGEPGLPLLDIFDAATAEAVGQDFRRCGLLSTRRTAESGRYQAAAEGRGATVLAPPPAVLARIDTMIDTEAFRGLTTPESLQLLRDTVRWFRDEGCDAVILGCTDLVLFGTEAIGAGILPVIDSTVVHARAAAARALTGLTRA
jgi:aspartate racemase